MQFKFAQLASFGALLLFLCVSARAAAADLGYIDELVSQAETLELESDRQWMTLLHYRRVLGGYESYVDSPAFFLAEKAQ